MTQGVLKTHGICLMMYFKNNWNAGPFFLLHGYFRRKKTHIYIYILLSNYNIKVYMYHLHTLIHMSYDNQFSKLIKVNLTHY